MLYCEMASHQETQQKEVRRQQQRPVTDTVTVTVTCGKRRVYTGAEGIKGEEDAKESELAPQRSLAYQTRGKAGKDKSGVVMTEQAGVCSEACAVRVGRMNAVR